MFAVPWMALTLNSGSHELVLDMDRERLENAPGFDPDDWRISPTGIGDRRYTSTTASAFIGNSESSALPSLSER